MEEVIRGCYWLSCEKKKKICYPGFCYILNEKHPVNGMLAVIAAAVYLDIFGFFFVQLAKTKLQDRMDVKTHLCLIFFLNAIFPNSDFGYFSRFFMIYQISTFYMTSFYLKAIKPYLVYILSLSLLFPLFCRIFCEILMRDFSC